jgi:hypothetical protein
LIRHPGGYFSLGLQRGDEEERQVGISFSIFLIAVGAVLAWAVSAEVSGVDIQMVGAILFIVGILGFIASLVFWSSSGSALPAARAAPVAPARRRPSSKTTSAWLAAILGALGILFRWRALGIAEPSVGSRELLRFDLCMTSVSTGSSRP